MGGKLSSEKHRVPQENLEQPCRDDHLCLIACEVTNWPHLAPFLGMTQSEMEAIERRWPSNTEAQRTELLRRWREKYGCEATYQKLREAFLKANRKALADKVCDIVCKRDDYEGSSEESGFSASQPARAVESSTQSQDLFSASTPTPKSKEYVSLGKFMLQLIPEYS